MSGQRFEKPVCFLRGSVRASIGKSRRRNSNTDDSELRNQLSMKKVILLNSLAAAVLGLGFCAQGDIVTDWNTHALNAFRTNRTAPPIASRQLAILHASIYDAVNGITRTHEPYRVRGKAKPNASIEAAAAAAGHRVMVTLFPGAAAIYDAAYQAQLQGLDHPKKVEAGIAWGESVANNILAWRATDGSADSIAYQPGTQPGQWIPTPPAGAPALLPQWPRVVPFAMSSGGRFRPPGPPPLNSAQYASDFDEVKRLGSVNSAERTEDQTLIAQFWANGAGTETPAGHWNRIAQSISAAYELSLEDNARMFALLNIAEADAAIVSWDCKFTYNLWRPVTAIRKADLDSNDATQQDLNWSPLLVTPPFPEYTSGHSTFSGAGSKVLESFFGTDNIAFSVNSDGTPCVFRTFTSLSQAANESGQSRIYGGIHFQSANRDGLASGRALGEYVANNFLRPRIGRSPLD
jgi:hypothetical protein